MAIDDYCDCPDGFVSNRDFRKAVIELLCQIAENTAPPAELVASVEDLVQQEAELSKAEDLAEGEEQDEKEVSEKVE